MTNRKIKDYHKNKLTYDILLDNLKMLSVILLTLNRHYPKLFYKVNAQKWFEEYAEWCEMMNDYEENDAYDWKMQEFCDKCGIDNKKTMAIAKKHLHTYHPKNMIVLQENVKLALVHTSMDFGFGSKRLNDLIGYLLEDEYPEWREDVKRFGIEIDAELKDVDYRKLKPKKKRQATYQEQKEVLKQLDEFRAYFDYVMSQEE